MPCVKWVTCQTSTNDKSWDAVSQECLKNLMAQLLGVLGTTVFMTEYTKLLSVKKNSGQKTKVKDLVHQTLRRITAAK